jgi:hypothetical protein
MSAFAESVFDFFCSETVEMLETTLGNVWQLKQGWNSFRLRSPMRPFLRLEFQIQSDEKQRLLIHLRDFDNNNFFGKGHWTTPGVIARIHTACPIEWMQVIDIFCPIAKGILIDVQAIGVTKEYKPYQFNAAQDFEVQSKEGRKKVTPAGLEFSNEFQDPFEVLIRSKNAFAEDTIYVEHFSADSATKISSGSQEEADIKGKVSFCKGGGFATLSETVIKSSGGKVSYQTEALIRGAPSVKITRMSENKGGSGYGRSYI